MRRESWAVRLTIFVGASSYWRHKPLYCEIVHRARKARLAGASVLRGIAGFGAARQIHNARLLAVGEDLPLVVVIVDAEEKIHEFLPQLDEIMDDGLVVLDRVRAITRLIPSADTSE